MDVEISERLINFIFFMPIFLISLAVHEFSHAYVASKLGDNTAKDLGRLTLNPLKHLDLIGSVVMPILSFLSGFILIGWAKPVPINPNNFTNKFSDDAKVSFAGPFSNFLLAVIFLVLLNINDILIGGGISQLSSIFWYGIYFNVFLCFFNMLPIPPLDGSHILFDLFPNRFTAKIISLGSYGTIILFIFIYSPLWQLFMNFVKGVVEIFNSMRIGL